MKPRKDSELKAEAKRSAGARSKERSYKDHMAKAKTAKRAYTSEWTKVYNRLKTANNKVRKTYQAVEKKKRNITRAARLKRELRAIGH
jgi:hypothetical protein